MSSTVGGTTYVSPVFEWPWSTDPRGEVRGPFAEFLTSKYSYSANAQVYCYAFFNNTDEATAYRTQRIGQLTRMTKVVEVDWKPVAPSAAPAAAAPSPEAATDSAIAKLPEGYRQRVIADVPEAKRWCETHPSINQFFDCDCFAGMYLDYRLKHADFAGMVREKATPPNTGVVYVPRVPFADLMTGGLDCTRCIQGDRIVKWAKDETRKAAAQYVAARQMSAANEKGLEECVAKQVVADFHARPTVYGDAAKGEFLDVAFRVCLRQYLRNT